MEDRVRINNGRSSTLKCPSNYSPSSFTTFLNDLKNGTLYVDVIPNNATGTNAGVSVVGTALNKANLLSADTQSKWGFDASTNPTPNDLFNKQMTFLTGTLSAGNTTLDITSSTIKTTSMYDIYIEPYGVFPDSVVATSGRLRFTFEQQSQAVTVKVRVL